MNSMNYIGLDIHKKSISCCVRQADGTIIQESTIAAALGSSNWLPSAAMHVFFEPLVLLTIQWPDLFGSPKISEEPPAC